MSELGQGAGGSKSVGGHPTLREVFEGGASVDAVEERRALADVKSRMFGRSEQPVTLSRYVLLERLGAGALGVVYAAFDPELERRVAIKLLRVGPGRQAGEHLVAEARAMAKLGHPNVIAVHDVGTYDEPSGRVAGVDAQGVFIVMELVHGPTLGAWMHAPERTLAELLGVFVDAGKGLAAAHAAGLVHRDFKPANALVDGAQRVRVLDFGLARTDQPTVSAALDGHSGDDLGSTRGVGTPAYMAPEQYEGGTISARADQFAFCVTLHEALYGVRPFAGTTAAAVHESKLAGWVQSAPPRFRLPRSIVAALARGLSIEPADRFASMQALVDALGAGQQRRRAMVGGAALVTSAGALTAALWPWSTAPCDDGTRLRQQLWSEVRRDTLANRFTQSGLPYAQQTWQTVDVGVSAYLDAWVRGRQRACEDETRPVADLNRERSCLDRGPEAVESLAAALVEATPADIERASELVEHLPPLAECTGAGGAVLDAATRQTLARAKTLATLGRYAETRAILEAWLESLPEDDRRPGEAEARMLLGRVLLAADEFDAARESLSLAVTLAERDRDDRVAFEAALCQGRLDLERAQPDLAQAWLALADAKAERGGIPETERLEVDVQRSRIAYQRGDDQAVERITSDLLRRATALLGKSHARVARVMQVRARSRARQGNAEGAWDDYAQSLEILAAYAGAEHPSTLQARVNYAGALIDLGQIDEGIQELLEVRETLLATGASDALLTNVESNLAGALAAAGRNAEALPLAEAVIQRMRAAKGDAHPDVGKMLLNLSGMQSEQGQTARAVESADQAVAILTEAGGAQHPSTLVAIAARARAWMIAGRTAEARAALAAVRPLMVEVLGEQSDQLVRVDLLLEEIAIAEREGAAASSDAD